MPSILLHVFSNINFVFKNNLSNSMVDIFWHECVTYYRKIFVILPASLT